MIKNIKGVTEIGKDTEKEQSSQQKTQKSPTNDVRSEHTPPIDTRKAKQDSDTVPMPSAQNAKPAKIDSSPTSDIHKKESPPSEIESSIEEIHEKSESSPKSRNKHEHKKETSKKKGKKNFYLWGVKPADVEFSLRHLSLMLKTGMNLTDSLKVIVEQVTDDRLKSTYDEVLLDVQQGKNIADSMARVPKVFSEVIVSIVRVSEQTGTLETNLTYLADYLKKNYELQGKVKGALIYPFIVLSLTAVEMLGVVFFILPRLEVMFASFENVPAFSLMVVNVAKFARENVLYIGVGMILFFVLVSRFSKTKTGMRAFDKIGINFPIIKKLTVSNILASFSRTLGMLLESSIPIADSLRITGETLTNSIYSEIVGKMCKDVKDGKNLAMSMYVYQKYFPISFIRVIEAGEKTGTLEENLAYMYGAFSAEVEEMSDNMVTLLEPLLLIFAGLMIGLLAITIVAPIYQFTSSIN